MHGGYYATLSVARELLGAGRFVSPSCWTSLAAGPASMTSAIGNGMLGAVRNKSKPVDADMIASWLHHSGPTPIW
jgi:hypothetical protein